MLTVVLDGHVANPGDLSWNEIEKFGEVRIYPRTSPDEVVERCADADVVLTNKVVIDETAMSRLPRLKYIGILATGYNNVDVEAARRRGIPVCNVPAYSTDSVAQTVFALLLEITNRVGAYSEKTARGEWTSCADFSFTLGPIAELSGMTMGIYGLGNIGRKVAEIAHAFGMKVVSPTSQRADAIPGYVEKVDFEEFLRRSDVVSLNAPLGASNRGLFNAPVFARMKRGAILINTARGPLVDEADLAAALRDGRIGAAGVDVLCQEPPRGGSPLLSAPNCFVTPHVAWQSTAARRRLLDVTASNIAAFLAGEPANVVN